MVLGPDLERGTTAVRRPGAGGRALGRRGLPAELARRFYYDSLVFDHRAIRYLLDMIGPDRLLVGSDFPAMPREEPAGPYGRAMGLADEVLDDITWHNCFRFLGLNAPDASEKKKKGGGGGGGGGGGRRQSGKRGADAPTLFSIDEKTAGKRR